MDKRELAYLAGIFDAEGSILIQKKKPGFFNKTVKYILGVTITNTRVELVLLAREQFGGNIVGPVNQKETQKPFYRWKLEGAKARDFLKEMEPYLIIKRDLLPLAYEFQDRIESYHRKPIDPIEMAARDEIYQRLRSLKNINWNLLQDGSAE